MPRELQIGDRVRTLVPLWDDRDRPNAREVPSGAKARVVDTWRSLTGRLVGLRFDGESDEARHLSASLDEVEPLPRDIPRERVEALHAAVTARLEQLGREVANDEAWSSADPHAVHSDLSEVAESLRLLLEVPDDAA